jgi:hypothetical protein
VFFFIIISLFGQNKKKYEKKMKNSVEKNEKGENIKKWENKKSVPGK